LKGSGIKRIKRSKVSTSKSSQPSKKGRLKVLVVEKKKE